MAMSVGIWRNAEAIDSTNGGMTSRQRGHVRVFVVGIEGMHTDEEVLNQYLGLALRLVVWRDDGHRRVYAEPVSIPAGMHAEFGRNFIFTDDVRFARAGVGPYPIPVHDRIEDGADDEGAER